MDRRRAAALLLALSTATLLGGGIALGGVSGVDRSPVAFDVLQILTLLATTIVGLAVAVRHPGNPMGWIFNSLAFVSALTFAAGSYAIHAFVIAPGSFPGGEWAAWFRTLAGNVTTAWLLLAFLLFPTGWLASPRWRPALVFPPLVAIGFATRGFVPGPMIFLGVPNPLGLEWVPRGIDQAAGAPLILGVVVAFAELVTRYRAARGPEREQIKWLVLPLAALVVAIIVTIVSGVFRIALAATVTTALFSSAFFLLPICMGIAILRYHLYDIDVLINRALVYGATTAGIAAAFFGGIVALQSILRPFTSGSELAVAASTLLSVALFQPLRGRVQRAVDRRFYRSRYDAARTLDEFSDRLRDKVDLDAVRADLVDAVRDTVQPAHASLWLRERAP